MSLLVDEAFKIEMIKQYAIKCHAQTNHMYGEHPYEYHLQMVVNEVTQFLPFVPQYAYLDVIGGAWCHDLIEDTRQTYNDVSKNAGEGCARIVYALTNEKGMSRSQRANDKYYEGILHTRFATLVKVSDRLANIKHSKETNSEMFTVYKNEHYEFCRLLKIDNYDNMYYMKLINLLEVEEWYW